MTDGPAMNGLGATGALYRLMNWMSPAFPIGSFSYSQGLETAVTHGEVEDRDSLVAWIAASTRHGPGLLDAVGVRQTMQVAAARNAAAMRRLTAELIALAGSAELRAQTLAQGRAFREAIDTAWALPAEAEAAFQAVLADPSPIPLPVAFGLAANGHAVPADLATQAYLSEYAANLVSAGVRLIPLGQRDGQRAIAALEPVIMETCSVSAALTLDTVFTSAPAIDLAGIQHETLYTRLFRS